MQKVEVTWGRAIKVWWAWTWRLVVYSTLLNTGLILITRLLEVPNRFLIMGVLALVLGLPIGWWVVKTVLGKSFSDFRLALLVPETETETDSPQRPQIGPSGDLFPP